jgi:hypothetical protein
MPGAGAVHHIKNGSEQLQQFHKANCRNLIGHSMIESHYCDSC